MSFHQPGRRRDHAAAASRAPRSLDLDAIEARIAANLPLLDALSAARRRRSGALVPDASTGLRLLAQGDSWFDHRPTDLADGLRRHGGHAVTSLALSGSTLDPAVQIATRRRGRRFREVQARSSLEVDRPRQSDCARCEGLYQRPVDGPAARIVEPQPLRQASRRSSAATSPTR